MSMSQQDFETAAHTMKKVMLGQGLHQKTRMTRRIPEHQKTLTKEEMKEVYALYKQATCGDVNIDKPGIKDIK